MAFTVETWRRATAACLLLFVGAIKGRRLKVALRASSQAFWLAHKLVRVIGAAKIAFVSVPDLSLVVAGGA